MVLCRPENAAYSVSGWAQFCLDYIAREEPESALHWGGCLKCDAGSVLISLDLLGSVRFHPVCAGCVWKGMTIF